MKIIISDGGRSRYFKADRARDCVTRAIVHATGLDYKKVYDDLFEVAKNWGSKKTKRILKIRNNASPRNGVDRDVLRFYIEDVLGFTRISLMKIGTGMTTHLREDELPKGILIINCSRHLTCVKDKVLYDTYDCTRGGERGVYGYWIKLQK